MVISCQGGINGSLWIIPFWFSALHCCFAFTLVCRYSLNKDASSNIFLFPAPSALGQLLSHLPSLLSPNLQSCSLLDDATLLPLSSSSPYLTSLTLSGCSLVSDPSLLAIASRLSYLQALGLAYTQVSLLILLYCIKALHTHSILTSYE